MADRDRPQQQQLSQITEKSPTSSQAIAVATLFPVGGILLTLSGLTLTATIVGLTAAFPVFLLFSPILVPAAALLGLAMMGFFVSGAMGVTAVAALAWVVGAARRVLSPENLERLKRRMAEAAGQVGRKTKDAGEVIQSRAHEVART